MKLNRINAQNGFHFRYNFHRYCRRVHAGPNDFTNVLRVSSVSSPSGFFSFRALPRSVCVWCVNCVSILYTHKHTHTHTWRRCPIGVWSHAATAASCDRTCLQASPPAASDRAAPGNAGHKEIMNRGMVSVRLCRPDAVPMS